MFFPQREHYVTAPQNGRRLGVTPKHPDLEITCNLSAVFCLLLTLINVLITLRTLELTIDFTTTRPLRKKLVWPWTSANQTAPVLYTEYECQRNYTSSNEHSEFSKVVSQRWTEFGDKNCFAFLLSWSWIATLLSFDFVFLFWNSLSLDYSSSLCSTWVFKTFGLTTDTNNLSFCRRPEQRVGLLLPYKVWWAWLTEDYC